MARAEVGVWQKATRENSMANLPVPGWSKQAHGPRTYLLLVNQPTGSTSLCSRVLPYLWCSSREVLASEWPSRIGTYLPKMKSTGEGSWPGCEQFQWLILTRSAAVGREDDGSPRPVATPCRAGDGCASVDQDLNCCRRSILVCRQCRLITTMCKQPPKGRDVQSN